MITVSREEALKEFGSNRVEDAEMATLMRNDRLNKGQQSAHIGEKWWKFVPRQDQLETMTRNR